eukprot:4352584-Amphidinium_carterae.1
MILATCPAALTCNLHERNKWALPAVQTAQRNCRAPCSYHSKIPKTWGLPLVLNLLSFCGRHHRQHRRLAVCSFGPGTASALAKATSLVNPEQRLREVRPENHFEQELLCLLLRTLTHEEATVTEAQQQEQEVE